MTPTETHQISVACDSHLMSSFGQVRQVDVAASDKPVRDNRIHLATSGDGSKLSS